MQTPAEAIEELITHPPESPEMVAWLVAHVQPGWRTSETGCGQAVPEQVTLDRGALAGGAAGARRRPVREQERWALAADSGRAAVFGKLGLEVIPG